MNVNGIFSNFKKHSKQQITDITIIKTRNRVDEAPQEWMMKCNDRKGDGRVTTFVQTIKTSSPTNQSRAKTLLLIRTASFYIETSGAHYGHDRVSLSMETTDIIQISDIIFYYSKYFSPETKLRSMG